LSDAKLLVLSLEKKENENYCTEILCLTQII
jgi:hypothetical protein